MLRECPGWSRGWAGDSAGQALEAKWVHRLGGDSGAQPVPERYRVIQLMCWVVLRLFCPDFVNLRPNFPSRNRGILAVGCRTMGGTGGGWCFSQGVRLFGSRFPILGANFDEYNPMAGGKS